MTKLDGNERWKGKMLLTEHQEQYDKRNNPPNRQQTEDERFLVRDYVVLPHMLTMVDNSRNEISVSRSALKSVMSMFLEALMNRISRQLQLTVREFGKRNIRVTPEEQSDDVYYYQVLCRGYAEKIGFTREVMRADIQTKLTKFADEVLKAIKLAKL